MNAAAEPLALLGGTFDPVHYAHLRVAEETRQKLGLETLYLMPAGSPPHRATPRANNKQRLDMLQLALEEFPHLKIDTRELDRAGPSYMVDTLRDFRNESPSRPLLLVVGQDAANHLQSWHNWRDLFELAHIVILTRPGQVPEYRQELAKQIEQRLVSDVQEMLLSEAGSVLPLKVAAIDICATTIKSMIRIGRSPRGMLPDAVLDYIDAQGLYRGQSQVPE